MARINGQLEFPINKIKNPNLTGPEIPDVQNTPLQMPGELRKTTQPVQTLTPVAPPTATAKTTAAVQQVAPVQPAFKPFGGVGEKLPQAIQQIKAPVQQVAQAAQTAQQKVSQAVTGAPVPKPIPTEAAKAPAVAVVENVEVAKAQTDLDQLNTFARDALLAPEDPISIAKFNQALTNVGLFNQAQRDLLQFQINAQEDLRGQPAGTALLTMLARQQNSDVSNLITNLSIESADRIRELNRWGFNALSNIVAFRETQKINVRSELLAAGDFDGYAAAFQRDSGYSINVQDLKELSPATAQSVKIQNELLQQALKSGDIDGARRHFDNIVALAPNTFDGADFDSLGFADQSYLLKGIEDEKVSAQIRLDIAQGEIGNAIIGIEAQFDETERIEGGTSLLQDKTLEEINAALEAAGFDTVADKTELLGREDELFTAFKIQELSAGVDRTIIDIKSDELQSQLEKDQGVIFDDDMTRAIDSYIFNLETGGFLQQDSDGNIIIDPNELVPPWDEKSDQSFLYWSWPVMDEDGTIVQESEFFTKSNPQPAPDTELGKLDAQLDKAWTSYVDNTAVEGRLTRLQWFHSTVGGTAEVGTGDVPEGLGRPDSGPSGDLDKEVFLASVAVLSDTEFSNKFDADSKFRNNIVGISTTFSTVGSLESMTPDSIRDDIITGPTKGYAKIGDSFVRFKDLDQTSLRGATETIEKGPQVATSVMIDIIDPTTGEVISTQQFFFDIDSNGERAGMVTQEDGPPITIEEFLARQKGGK